jgi:Isochorismatase family
MSPILFFSPGCRTSIQLPPTRSSRCALFSLGRAGAVELSSMRWSSIIRGMMTTNGASCRVIILSATRTPTSSKDSSQKGHAKLFARSAATARFFATDLALFLREQGVERVIIAGVKTNVCIRATVQDAFANGFDAVVPREATNSNRPHLAEASLEDIQRYFGEVVSLDRALEMLG